jgi:hypothetical protein
MFYHMAKVAETVGSLLIISVEKGGRTEVQDGSQEGSEVTSR